MDKLHFMKVFVAVAEGQGFAVAARRLNISPPSVTRAIATLEQQLGVKLLIRTTRHVRTTEAGYHYLQDIKRILADIDAADESALGIHTEPKGELSITAPAIFGRLYVIPVVTRYLRRYEDVNVSTLFVDRIVNLMEEGLDIGIRIGDLPDSSLRAIKVGTVRLISVASPAYLAKYGAPQKPDDLARHNVILSQAVNNSSRWRFKHEGEAITSAINARLSTTTNDSAINAALQGFGITRILSYQVAPYLISAELQVVLNAYEPEPIPVSIVHSQGRNTPAKVRAFIDLAVDMLRADKGLN